MIKTGFSGAQYFTKGLQLVRQKGIRSYVIIPLTINMLLLLSATIWALNLIDDWMQRLYAWSGDFGQWILDNLGWLIWPIIVISVLLGVFYSFAILANWIAAPFNGLLAEAVEKHLAGEKYQENHSSTTDMIKDIPRLFGREMSKFKYWLPKALLCLLLFLIPVVNLAAPFVWLLFSAWMMAVQYVDYPMDNHKHSFEKTLSHLRASRGGAMGFGGTVMFVSLVPILNILVMPVAVAGATALWFDNYRGRD